MRLFPVAFLIMAVFLLGIVSMLPQQEQGRSEQSQYLIVNFPWRDFEDTYELALNTQAMPISSGALPFLMVVASHDDAFVSHAYDQGAFMVLNPIVLGACVRKTENRFVDV